MTSQCVKYSMDASKDAGTTVASTPSVRVCVLKAPYLSHLLTYHCLFAALVISIQQKVSTVYSLSSFNLSSPSFSVPSDPCKNSDRAGLRCALHHYRGDYAKFLYLY